MKYFLIVFLLSGCGAAAELLKPNPSTLKSGLIVQNPTCLVFCFSESTETLRTTDIDALPNIPDSKRTIPEPFYP